MDFQNAFSNVNYGMAVDAANQRQNNFLNSLAQGIAIAEKRAQRDELMRQQELNREAEAAQMAEGTRRWEAEIALKRQAMDQRNQGFDLKKMAAQSLMQEGIASGLTPEQAAASAYAKMNPITFTNPDTGMMEVAPRYTINAQPQAMQPQQQAPAQQMDRSMLQGAIDYMQPQAMQPQQALNKNEFSDIDTSALTPLQQKKFNEQVAFDKLKKAQKSQELRPAKEQFEKQLEKVLMDLDELKAQGGAISEEQGVIQNIGSQLAEAPIVGKMTQSAFDPETQTIRDRIEGKRPTLFNAIKKATGLTGGELNSQFEVENQLKQLGSSSMTYEARKSLLTDLSETFGTGELANKLGTTEKQSIKDKYGLK